MKKLLLIFCIAVFVTGFAYAGTIHVTYPNGGEALCKGAACTITWTSTGITTPLRVVLVKGGTRVGDIATGLSAATTSCSWTVGNYIGGTVTTGTDYQIRVRADTSGPTTEVDDSDANFTIKNCVVQIDPRKYLLVSRCRIPGPGCPGCPPEFDLSKIREQIGDLRQNTKLVLLKNGTKILEFGSIGKGKRLPNSVKGKLSEADLSLLQNGGAKFAIGLLGENGQLLGSSPVEMQ